MPRVSVNLVTWNSQRYLADALDSIFEQTYQDFVVQVIDNASDDGSAEFVRQKYPKATVLKNSRNLGFCRAHNQGFAWARQHMKEEHDPLVLVTNPDIIMEPDFLQNLVAEIDRRPSAGSAGGRVLRAIEKYEDGFREAIKTETIDTVGLQPFRSGRIADRGAGLEAADRYRSPEEVFGVSGCIGLYRLAALNDAAYDDGSVFDEDFFAYKEDVDLAWRLQLLGWKSAYAPDAVAYHFRAAGGGERPTKRQVIRGRRGRSDLVKQLSARNHLLMLFKNLQAGNLIRHWPRLWAYETQKILYSLLFEPKTFRAGLSALPYLPRAAAKRRQVMGRAKAQAADIRRWLR